MIIDFDPVDELADITLPESCVLCAEPLARGSSKAAHILLGKEVARNVLPFFERCDAAHDLFAFNFDLRQ